MSEPLSPPASAPVQESKKHHYLPEFYLSAWCTDGKLERYLNRNGTIHTRRFTSGQVGYREDLYRLLSATVADRTIIERHHFEQLDNAAARVVARLNRDIAPILSEADKEIIARFMISLPARNPWGIAVGQKISRETYGLALSDETDARDLGLPENRTIWKQINDENPHFVADSTLMQMIEVSTDEKLIDRFARMHWAVFDVGDAPIDLIVGDHAFLGHGNLKEDGTGNIATIPLGPKKFVMCSGLVRKALPPIQMVKIMNRQSAERAAEHFYATDRKHLALAKARLRPLGTWKPLIKREPEPM